MSNVTRAELETNPEWLDPEEFPFTEIEVRDAATLWRIHGEAVRFARELAELERTTVRKRSAWRAEEEARAADPERILFIKKRPEDPSSSWLWPALSVLSESCAARVRDLMSRHWERRAQGLLMAAQTEELKRDKTIAEVIRLTSEKGDQEEIRALIAQARRDGIGLKPPTDEMCRAAAETVEREKIDWLALAVESKRRFDAATAATGSPPATPRRP